MMRALARLVATLFGAGLLVAAALVYGWALIDQPGPLAEDKTLLIPRGSGVQEIAHYLARTGVIDSELAFVAAAQVVNNGAALKAGEYVFPAGLSVRGTVDLLQSGKTVVRRLTVPEGYTSAQILDLLRNADGLFGDIRVPPPEGSLLPETYHYSWGDSRELMIERMRTAMQRAIDAAWAERAKDLPISSKREAVILASIVERETGVAGERPRVAGVFVNRLRRGMKLQSDPTVIYGLSNGTGSIDRSLTKGDLAAQHPYNTYVIEGLPPAPIANPGVAALKAVMNPAATDELYFVADGTGGHVFARTLAEHNRNVAQWRRIERDRAETD